MQKIYEKWLNALVNDKELNDELVAIKNDTAQIEDRFFKELEFGTAGLRGVIGAGTNRMNVYTVAKTSAGFANYLNKKGGKSIVISYDSRIKSLDFAKVTAEVFATNGIKAYIFDTLMPVAVCSFAIRHLKASAGVMITASHNPKEYNGYKAYGADGCQLNLTESDSVLKEIENISDCFNIKRENFDNLIKAGKIEYIQKSLYDEYLKQIASCSVESDNKKDIKIIFTPLNGAGNIPVRDILKLRGFENITVVAEQELPDGNFTTCPKPNPEERDALNYALTLAQKQRADLVLGTDPDCDRVGIAALTQNGDYRLFTGNETGLLMLEYLLRRHKTKNTLPKNPIIIKTITTIDLAEDVAKSYGVQTLNMLVGFKFIGEKITELEKTNQQHRFVFGFEESYGCLCGTHARDKDAVVACMLIAEMCYHYKKQGITLDLVLENIYKQHGYFKAIIKNISFTGMQGLTDMNAAMNSIRSNPPKIAGGQKITKITDYENDNTGLPKSNVLAFYFEGGKVLCRPSGTEPKLKIYTMAKNKDITILNGILTAVEADFVKYFTK